MRRRQGKRPAAAACRILMILARLAGCLAVTATAVFAAAPAWSHDCVVKEWAVAAGVAARQPYGKASSFSAARLDEVLAFANLDCTKVTGVAVFRFFRDNRMVLAVETPLRAGENWRTWAAVRAQPGRYIVMLEIEQVILIEDTFEVTE